MLHCNNPINIGHNQWRANCLTYRTVPTFKGDNPLVRICLPHNLLFLTGKTGGARAPVPLHRPDFL